MLKYLEYLENNFKHPIKLKILDLILLSPDTKSPIKWISTNKDGFISFRILNPITFSNFAQSILSSLSLEEINLTEYKIIVSELSYIG